MRWKPGRGRGQIVDRRGAGAGGGGGFPMPIPMGKGGLGGLGLIGIIIAILFSTGILGGGGGSAIDIDPRLNPFPVSPPAQSGEPFEPTTELEEFVGFVVDDVQDTWTELFRGAEQPYEPTKLVLFEQAVQSGCGVASSETGPFYCPLDSLVYLDLGFFQQLRSQFGAPGDFAQAYVIAHEFGHHVQNVLGVSDAVRQEQQANPDQANELSIRLELQADCLAGVWAHSAYRENVLEPGDLQEGLRAAAAVGDDRIQRKATGQVNPETWTHGSAEQRQQWFTTGYESGDPGACDTFAGDV